MLTYKQMQSNREWLLFAYELGYRVLCDGTLVNSSGKALSTKGKGSAGYPGFCVQRARKKKIVLVHRLAGLQKYGPKIFEPGMVVRHLNDDPTDNSWDNICLGTQGDNVRDAFRNGRCRLTEGLSNRKLRKLSFSEAEGIRRDRIIGMSWRALSTKYGVSSSVARSIVAGVTYKSP